MTIKDKIKILEHRLDSGIKRLEELKADGVDRETRHSVYKVELDLEHAYIDYVLTAYDNPENKIKSYGKKIRNLVT